MIDQLFGSKTRVKLLKLFLSNPNRSFYVREITRKIDEQINSVRRELSNLLKIGIITSESNNNRLYYEVNQKYPHYQAMRSIFSGKGVDISDKKSSDDDTTKAFKELGSVSLALLTGVFTRDPNAPVDLLVVGNVNRTQLEHLVEKLEKEENQEVRFSSMSQEDFEYRRGVKDRFVDDVLSAKVSVVIDKNGYTKKN